MDTSRETLWQAVKRIVWPDIKSRFSRWFRSALESVIPGAAAWGLLKAYGSGDAPMDSLIERIALVICAVIAFPVGHILWSFLKLPWALYCEQRTEIAAVRSDLAEFKTRTMELKKKPDDLDADRLEVERLRREEEGREQQKKDELDAWNRKQNAEKVERARAVLMQQADDAPGDTATFNNVGKTWSDATMHLLEETVKRRIAMRFKRYSTPGDTLRHSVASLKAIAVNLSLDDLNY